MKRTLALALGIALPTVLLGAGWLWSTVREREGRTRELEARLTRSADAVRAAVDASLEELRAREDQRPFYLYNHFYSPPDVLAISDPVALSPLARRPDDARIVGWFQIDPDGAFRTPHAPDAEVDVPTDVLGLPTGVERTAGRDRAARVLEVARNESLASLRGDIRGEMNPALVPTVADAGMPDAGRTQARRRYVRRQRPAGEASMGDENQYWLGGGRDNAGLRPEGPLTVSLNQWGQDVYNDVAQAYQGDPEANLRVQQRGRSAPITRRVTRRNADDWQEAQQQQRSALVSSTSSARPSPQRSRVRPRPSSRPAPEPAADGDGSTPDAGTLPLPVVRDAADIDYTPMAWSSGPDALVLHRLVSHEGAAVVQGVVLDRAHVVERWLPSVVQRHAVADAVPAVVNEGDAAQCHVRRPASSIVSGVELCFAPAALGAAVASADADLRLQLGALGGLLFVVLLAAFVIHRAARRADELSRQKSAFVSAVSHELRTPLTTIRMHAEMLREGMVSEGKRDRFHDDLVNESVRLSRLVENVLEISRIEEGRRPFKPSRGDLRQHVRAVLAEQRPFVEAKGFELVGPAVEEPVELDFDHQALEQIVVNLVDNAVKYAGGEHQRIEVVVGVEGPNAIVSVLDRGPGIPQEQRQRVFERFVRVERAETAHMPGTGIGLALVADLARAHGGRAAVQPRPGGGTEVRVSLPLHVR